MKVLILIPILFLAACTTPEGRKAKADTATIQHNDATATASNQRAQSANDAARVSNGQTADHLHRAQTLLERIDAKDKFLGQYSE